MLYGPPQSPMSASKTHIGPGCLSRLEDIFNGLGATSIFLVADAQAYTLSGAERLAAPALSHRRVTVFDAFAANPQLADAKKGLALWDQHPSDAILAIGGGSAIDMAKLVGVLTANPGRPEELATGATPVQKAGPPLVAVPTTAGTGAEATHFAVVYVAGKKYSLAHPSLLPHTAVIDPDLMANLPPALSAHTGLDALCQAIESLWSVNADDASLADARQALTLAWRHLVPACRTPAPADRLGMCRAAHLAGRAINRSKTTAPHALSYALTSEYGVPHGLAVALSLGPILEYNAAVSVQDATDPRGPDWTRQRLTEICTALGASTPTAASQKITDLLHSLECPTRLSAVGVCSADQIQKLAASVNAERLANNPRHLDTSSIHHLISGIV
jgi:alcohol dehydrogenase